MLSTSSIIGVKTITQLEEQMSLLFGNTSEIHAEIVVRINSSTEF